MQRPYRKHKVLINSNYITVKNWMRANPQFFNNDSTVPTSEQIGMVLIEQGFTRTDGETEVIYR